MILILTLLSVLYISLVANIAEVLSNRSMLLHHVDDAMKVKDIVNASTDDLQQRLTRLREKLSALKLTVSEVTYLQGLLCT